MGYSNPGAAGLGYIAALKLSAATVRANIEGRQLDEVTAGIASYDRCEAADAYMGQINMLRASSFCGINGAVWGYHLAAAGVIQAGELKASYRYSQQRQDGKLIPVYRAEPLLDCTKRLFGTAKQRRFPLMPGAHVICAYKSETRSGPAWVWAAIALAIAEDRETAASVFIEDHGSFDGRGLGESDDQKVKALLEDKLRSVTASAIICGEDQNALYREIFASYKYTFVPEGCSGTALACAPYILLAQDAVPASGAASMNNMTISQWEEAIGLSPLAAE
jgi:histidine decarboxylase